MSQTNKTIVGFAVVAVLAIAFWVVLVAPKREEADELSKTASNLQTEVSAEQTRAAAGTVAKQGFPRAYRELVVLGKAVPKDAEAASLLVQLNQLGRAANTRFKSIALSSDSSSAEGAVPAEAGGESGELLPIGATVGSAGLPTMPYQLEFTGSFFGVADFIHGVDAQVKTVEGKVDADGRLITINGFTLKPEEGELNAGLKGEFTVTTYVAPPGQGLTGGATTAGPEGATP
jgi:Tfp pilus assembly protein PilO